MSKLAQSLCDIKMMNIHTNTHTEDEVPDRGAILLEFVKVVQESTYSIFITILLFGVSLYVLFHKNQQVLPSG